LQSLVFAPSHITGFFEIVDHHNPLIKGSRGAGVTLDQGVLTQVEICEGDGEIIIKNNGKINHENYPLEGSVSYKTLDLLQKRFQQEIEWDNIKIIIQHQIQVPIESGFGVSAGSALGTSLGVSHLLKLPLTFNQAAAFAHCAEVELNTGLGDVMGSLVGGFPLRVEPGAPGVGKADKLLNNALNCNGSDEGLYVIYKSMGAIETSSVLKDPAMTNKVNNVARDLLQKLISNPRIPYFMNLSLKFARETGLIDTEIMEIVNVMNEETLGASMAMLGKTAFAISETPDSSVEGVSVVKIDSYGCRFK
jgi:pantoate kinase